MDIGKLMGDLDKWFEESAPRLMGKPDWSYRDLPKVTTEVFQAFVDHVGEENLFWITKASYEPKDSNDGPTLVRGQVLISPEGMKRVEEFEESKDD
jgi:hypothetical protein